MRKDCPYVFPADVGDGHYTAAKLGFDMKKLTLVGAMPSTVKLREDYSAEERSTRAGVCSLRTSSRRTACIGGNACFGRVRRRRKISKSSGAGADRLWKMVGD